MPTKACISSYTLYAPLWLRLCVCVCVGVLGLDIVLHLSVGSQSLLPRFEVSAQCWQTIKMSFIVKWI